MLKVIHIISGDLWAGAEVMAYCLIKELSKYQDIVVSSIVMNEGKLADELRNIGIRTFVINEKVKSFPNIIKMASNVIKENSPDVIHSHRYKENILAYILSLKCRNVGKIATQHGIPDMEQPGRKMSLRSRVILGTNNQLLSKRFEKIVVVSDDMANYYIGHLKFPKERITVIHNGIPLHETFCKKGNENIFVIGSIGRFFPVKDYPLFVEVARETVKIIKDVRFMLAGDGPEMGKIRRMIETYNLGDSFHLTGFMNDVSEFYSGLDVYMNTSLHEGIPMSVLEAMAHGLPVIAPKVGGLREIVEDGVEGFLLAGRNPVEYSEKCCLLYQDKMLRKNMGRQGLKKVMREFTVEEMARRYYLMYQTLDSTRGCYRASSCV